MTISFVASYGPGAIVGASSATPTSTAPITCAAGDLLLVGVATSNGRVVPASVSGGGLTWTKVSEANPTAIAANSCMTWFAATATSAQTFTATVTVTDTSSSVHQWTWTCQRWSGAALTGYTWQQPGSSSGQLSFTTSVASGALVTGISDWNAVAGSRSYVTASAGSYVETVYQFSAGNFAAYLGYHANDGTAAAKTVGTSAPTGVLDAIAVVELGPPAPNSSIFLGSLSSVLRFGSAAVSKLYVGAVQAWASAAAARATRIDPATMSGPYYTALPANPILDANNAAKVATLASAAGKYAGLKWVTACFATTDDNQYNIVYDQDPQEQSGGAFTWALNQPSFRSTAVEPVRIPDQPNFYSQAGNYASGSGWDGWGCVIDPARGIGWAGWRMVKNGTQWQATTAHSFAVPGSLTSVTSGLARGDGLPIIAGSITVQEAAAAFADTTGTYVIPHALSIAVPASMVDTAHRAPATKTDGSVTPTTSTLTEGSRFYLPASAAISSSNRLMKAIFRTMQTYGVFITDRTGGNSITLNFEWFDPAKPADMVDPTNGSATTLANANAIAGAYYRAGFTYDYFDLSPLPWASLQLMAQYDGGGTGTPGPASGLGGYSGNANPIAAITETFASKDTTNGAYGTGASVVSGQLNLVVASSYAATWTSAGQGDLTNSTCAVQLVQAPNVGNGSTEAYFLAKLDANNLLSFSLSGSTLSFNTKSGGTSASRGSVTYSAATHKYLRFRGTGTQVIAETSADKSTWTQLGTAWTPTFAITNLQVVLNAGYYGTESSPGTAIFDNLNV